MLLALALPVLPPATPSNADLWWGALAGVAGGIAVALLYRALAVGTMSIVAPITAVTAVALPVLTSIALGERPGRLAVLGILLGIVSIVLVSRQPSSPSPEEPAPSVAKRSGGQGVRTGIGPALIAGIAMGIFLLALAQTGSEAGLWPLLTDRIASIAFFGIVMAVARASPRLPRSLLALALGCGTLDMAANALFLIAVRIGPFSPIVTLCALYPATTVLLARTVLAERLSAWQAAGVVSALMAVVLIVSG